MKSKPEKKNIYYWKVKYPPKLLNADSEDTGNEKLKVSKDRKAILRYKLFSKVFDKTCLLIDEIEKEFTEVEKNIIEDRNLSLDISGKPTRDFFRQETRDFIIHSLYASIPETVMSRIYVKRQGENRSKGAMKNKFIPDKIEKPLFDLMEAGISLGTSLRKLNLDADEINTYKKTFPKMAEQRIKHAKNNPSFKNEPVYEIAIKFLELYEKNKKNRKPTK